MKILPPALAFALGLAVAAGTEPRTGGGASGGFSICVTVNSVRVIA
mgnify:CR=1 FL=1